MVAFRSDEFFHSVLADLQDMVRLRVYDDTPSGGRQPFFWPGAMRAERSARVIGEVLRILYRIPIP